MEPLPRPCVVPGTNFKESEVAIALTSVTPEMVLWQTSGCSIWVLFNKHNNKVHLCSIRWNIPHYSHKHTALCVPPLGLQTDGVRRHRQECRTGERQQGRWARVLCLSLSKGLEHSHKTIPCTAVRMWLNSHKHTHTITQRQTNQYTVLVLIGRNHLLCTDQTTQYFCLSWWSPRLTMSE